MDEPSDSLTGAARVSRLRWPTFERSMALKRPALSAPLAPKRLLLVADTEPTAGRVVADALGLRHDQIRQATDGRIALALALTSPFACVITEASLPFIDGYSLCELLRADHATRSIPILVVTAEAGAEAVARALQAGANGVLMKPVDAKTLRAEIDRVTRLADDGADGAALRPTRPAIGQADDAPRAPLPSKGGLRLKSRTHDRFETDRPPLEPPGLNCPSCDRALTYRTSHIGGVSERFAEQWDYYDCSGGCRRVCYRHRTRKVHAI